MATDQYLRDFVATLMHELVHVLQWERDEWEDDGEKEAEDKQYELADEFWKEGDPMIKKVFRWILCLGKCGVRTK